MCLHEMTLITRCVTTKQYILGYIVRIALLDEKGVLHVACRMVCSKIKFGKYVQVIINFRTIG